MEKEFPDSNNRKILRLLTVSTALTYQPTTATRALLPINVVVACSTAIGFCQAVTADTRSIDWWTPVGYWWRAISILITTLADDSRSSHCRPATTTTTNIIIIKARRTTRGIHLLSKVRLKGWRATAPANGGCAPVAIAVSPGHVSGCPCVLGVLKKGWMEKSDERKWRGE